MGTGNSIFNKTFRNDAMGNTTQSLSIDTLALDISLLIAHVASPF